MKTKLTCRDCGASKLVFPSQIGMRYHLPADQYRCRPCWNKVRKGKRVNPTVKQERSLACEECGKISSVTSARAGNPTAYRCRPCYLAHKARNKKPKKQSRPKRFPTACVECGRIRLVSKRDAARKSGLCLSCKNKGARAASWRGGKVTLKCCVCGKEKAVSKSRAAASIRKGGKYYCCVCARSNKPCGAENSAWKGGKSFEPYPTEWTAKLKRLIRARDGNCCVVCGGRDKGRKLAIHHIDYNKVNLDQSNLASLCMACHAKTNFNRAYWKKRLSEQAAERGATCQK